MSFALGSIQRFTLEKFQYHLLGQDRNISRVKVRRSYLHHFSTSPLPASILKFQVWLALVELLTILYVLIGITGTNSNGNGRSSTSCDPMRSTGSTHPQDIPYTTTSDSGRDTSINDKEDTAFPQCSACMKRIRWTLFLNHSMAAFYSFYTCTDGLL